MLQKSQSYVLRYDIFQLDAPAAISYDNWKINYLTWRYLRYIFFSFFFLYATKTAISIQNSFFFFSFSFLIRPNNCNCLKEIFFQICKHKNLIFYTPEEIVC